MVAASSLRRRTLRIFVLTALVFTDYFSHPLLSFFKTSSRRQASRRRLHRRNAVRLREAAVSLKGILIKMGQFLSTRVDLLPEEYTEEFALLQDQVPPVPFIQIRKRIQEELGKDPLDLFSRFEEVPVASASLGQVHGAQLDGRKVAVKVQYPGIQDVVEADLRAVRIILVFLKQYIKTIRFDILYDEFSTLLHKEMDYIKEGKNAERFRENFSQDARIVVPKVIWSHSTRHVLTLEYVEGIKINQFEAMKAQGISLKDVATLLVESYIQQILEFRFFHGDPHPGNLFIQPHPDPADPLRLVFVDFGLMQEVSPETYEGIQRMILAIINRDNHGIALAMRDLGFISRTEQMRDIEKVVSFFMERYRDLSPRQFGNITFAQVAEDFATIFRVFPNLQVPDHFILFARTSGMLNGLCSRLNPDLNLIELARPHAERFANRGDMVEQLFKKGKGIAKSLAEPPETLHRFLTVAYGGQLRTAMRSADLSTILTRIHRLISRAFLSILVLALLVYLRYLAPSLPRTEQWLVGGVIVLLTLSALFSYLREGRMR